MDGVTKDKLPKMITTAQDPFDDSDMHKAAEEAYTYILNAPGTILKVFILAVTNDDIAEATARLELLGKGGLEQELETRFAFELGKRNEEYKAAGGDDVKAQDAAANAKAAGGGLWAGPVSKALRRVNAMWSSQPTCCTLRPSCAIRCATVSSCFAQQLSSLSTTCRLPPPSFSSRLA